MTDKTTAPAYPFANDVAYLEAEGAYVLARSARLDAERRLAESRKDGHGRRDTIGSKSSTASKELERRSLNLIDAEDRLRRDVDERIAATTATGKVLGIDGLCGEFSLNPVERTTLLLSVLTAIDEKYEEAARGVADAFNGQVTPELVWAYMELAFADRILGRAAFHPTSPLLKNGLVTLTVGHSSTPYDLRSACLNVTQLAFDRIVGLPTGTRNHDDGADL